MTTIFLISDSHFGHANILNFKLNDGTPMRPGFADVEDMNWKMVEAWNSVVKAGDHVYHLGDFAMKQQDIAWAKLLNGHKRLVRGNHDIYQTKTYMQMGFKEIYGVRVFDDLILSHIPLHPESLKQRWTNVHGHVHNNVPADHFGPRYFNVSVEVINYTPVTLEQVRAAIAAGRNFI